ncbi:MAG: hypothetical protein IH934_06705 [Nanoarchaeota archaeon]|nr:hypothetical protein [Nanoarchaeota archaeon]
MRHNKNNAVRKMFFILVVITLFFAAIIQVSSDIEQVKYSDLEKEEIGEDDESQEALREYYGEVLGKVKIKPKFNNIATHGDLAIISVTIDGRNSRILTRIRDLGITTQQINYSYGDIITTNKLIVLGNISLKENLFFEAENTFGPRRFFGLGSTTFKYVDEGFSRLVNGESTVSINPILRELISGYNVFLSAEGLTRGIYVAEKTSSYFVVKSVDPNSNVAFSWMLRGVKKSFDEYLSSRDGREKNIEITAEIYFEDGYTEIKIDGLDKILALVHQKSNGTIINESANNNNQNYNSNETNNQSSTLITGNLIDEFGLETDLGKILSNSTQILPTIGEENNDSNNNNLITTQSNENNNASSSVNETIEISDLEFTLQSVDEDFIVSQIASVTGLSTFEVKKLVNFIYAEPQGFEEEVIDLEPKLDFIEKINGSVIIKLG